jgi:AcrR family transcriptional regulator
MSSSHESSPAPRAPRNRALTEAKLRKAVEDLLVEGGFSALTPSAVGKRAGVDKMLIYRYFGDLQGLIRAIAYAEDFFPTFEVMCGGLSVAQMLALPVNARAARLISNNARALLARPVVLELMVWELVERNELTAIMEEARETLGLRVLAELFPDVRDARGLRSVGALLSAAVSYLALRRRKIRWYSGVDLTLDETWSDFSDVIARMTDGLDV